MGQYSCEHNKNKYICLICNPNKTITKYTCPHGKQCKSRCKECLGHSVYKEKCSRCHKPYKSDVELSTGKLLQTCPKCRVESCPHGNRIKSSCKQCNKEYRENNKCPHKKRKNRCEHCTPNHKNERTICKHNKRKEHCKDCGGSALCKNDWCLTRANSKYKNYCLFCFIEKFPNEKVVRNYKIKEKHVVDCVLEKFPNFTWFHDKRIEDGCSLRRPDLFLDYGTHVIMIEIDEHKHESYDCSCVNRRTMELSLDINHRPCVIIRFNPDGYIDQHNNKVKSPWKIHKKLGVLSIMKTHQEEWNNRLKNLLDCIDYWTQNPTDKIIEMIELFY
jgi:hypothetical protein